MGSTPTETSLVFLRSVVPSVLGRVEGNRNADLPLRWLPCSSGDPIYTRDRAICPCELPFFFVLLSGISGWCSLRIFGMKMSQLPAVPSNRKTESPGKRIVGF